ncbi:MAG: acyltransferase [Chloroflexota bacterium]
MNPVAAPSAPRLNVRIHPTADVAESASLGEGTAIWNYSKVANGASLGRNCKVGSGAYIDVDVEIGDNCKIHNRVLVHEGAVIESGVFLGPGTVITNDMWPRAITPDGELKSGNDWEVGPVRVCYGASVGAGSIILPNVTIGRFALVGAGSVVTRDVPDYALVVGHPARQVGWACECGHKLAAEQATWRCPACNRVYDLPSVPASRGPNS